MDKQFKIQYFNHKTGQFEYGPDEMTDEKAREYIPQIAPAQGIYECRRGLGDTVLEAMLYTLTACVKASKNHEDA